MSFADQRGMLCNALRNAGLAPDAAAEIAGILANSAQDSLQSSRTRTDTTPDGLRYVGPDSRKQVFQNMDFLPGDPDYRPQMGSATEERSKSRPAPNVTEKLSPQQTSAVYRLEGGNLADASGAGDSVEVNVRSRIAKQSGGRLPMTLLDRQTNTLVGKSLRTSAGGDDARVRLGVTEGKSDVNVNLNLENLSSNQVVTGIVYEPGIGLRVEYGTVAAWHDKGSTQFIRMSEQQVVTEVVDDLLGPRTHTAFIPSFQSRPRVNGGNTNTRGNLGEDLWFNLIRVGTFTGGWAAGTAKVVSQEWPYEGRDVTVFNQCRSIADTESEKYVLFIPRTDDKKKPSEVRGEDENPVPLLYDPGLPPNVVYYAVEIQEASECVAFSSLNGKLLSDLEGFSSGVQQALSHNATGCPEWVGEEIEVITDVSIGSGGLTFSKKKVTVLKAVEHSPAEIGMGPVQAVQDLEFDGVDILGSRKVFYAFNVSTTTDTYIPTVPVDALSSLYMGGGGLYADKNELRVLKVTPKAPDTVDVTECPSGGSS